MGNRKQHGKPPRGKSGNPDRRSAAGKPDEEKTTADYYRLKTEAVEDLVTANEENSPPVSAAELRKYRSGPQIKLADWVKVLLLKFWTGGMICYFFIWGLSTFTLNQWDHLLVLGIALGTVTHLITNNILRFIAATPGLYDRWMMFPGGKIWLLQPDRGRQRARRSCGAGSGADPVRRDHDDVGSAVSGYEASVQTDADRREAQGKLRKMNRIPVHHEPDSSDDDSP